ncbi:winged helix-turn-helix domain-containing protein [Lysobacter sp. S4-A87]|uniref:winged helix-turn-helix domain-containing protein n=1 Tax=Lysobacter sp. S4-A87 TaxID=2925843 RepID=UPI001F53D273|nr:winged helix-turn-helix domain-containing protein [Lysobacter sp. S4-A87]UNK48240.1 winged helix-turn-helix domain-containing protein [Lysobacter sp. S4-A87]
MTRPTPPVLRFDDIVLDLPGRRLLRAGQPQPLEPKAFAVLELLAGSPGQVFCRDEILDAVWGHRHVTPGVLNRVITLVRHALGEDAHSSRYLHTVYGYGYRFDLPAQTQEAASVDDAPVHAAVVAAVANSAPAVDEASAGVPLPVEALPTTPVLAPAARSPARRWLRHGAAMAIALVAVAVSVWLWRSPRPGSQAAPAPVLAVLPMRAVGDDPRGQAFADGLSEEMIGLLAHIDGLRVISHTASFKFRDPALPMTEVARQLQATHLLEGSVRQDGERLRISLHLVEADANRTIWSQSFDREFRDIFAVQRSIAYAIANTLELQLGLSATSSSAGEDPALYRRYLLARNASPRAGEDRGEAAEAALRELTLQHPDYARAQGGLAVILWGRSLSARPGRDALRAEAEQMAARALQLDPQQPEAHAVIAAKACRAQQWSECMRLSQLAIKLAPSDAWCRGWYAYRLATLGYVQQALRETDEALKLAPFDQDLHFWRGRLLDTLGRHEEAQEHLALAPPDRVATASFFNAVWRRDYTTAQRLVEALPADLPWRASELAAVAALRDPTLWPAVPPAIDVSERHPLHGQVPYDFTRLLLPVRDYARDIDGLDAVQQAGYASYQWVFWQPESRELRQHPAFQRYLQRSGIAAYWREHGWPDVCRADGVGVACD